MKNSTVNKFIARKYLCLVNKNQEYSQLECDKIEYVIKVLLSEVEKILLLSIIFVLQGKFNVFLFCFFMIISIRMFMGGTHRKTFWGCFFFSLTFFQLVITLGNRKELAFSMMMLLYFVYIGYIIWYAPIQSEQKPRYGKKKRLRFKIYSFLITSMWFVLAWVCQIRFVRQCIQWSLLLQMLELLRVKWGEKVKATKVLQKLTGCFLALSTVIVSNMGCYSIWGEIELPESIRSAYDEE